MPEFIKSHNPSSTSPQTTSRFTGLSRSSHSSPQFQVRSGLPGQPQNQPSPFDRINRDRSSHLRKQQSNHRRDSPTHSPIRSDTHNRFNSSPSRNSNPRSSPEPSLNGTRRADPAVNGAHSSVGRNSPISRASPLSPLANTEIRMDPNKKLDAADAIELADQIISRFLEEKKKSALDRLNDAELDRPALVAVVHHILTRAVATAQSQSALWLEIIKKWSDKDTAHEAVNKWFENMQAAGDNDYDNIAIIISGLIVNQLIEPRELEIFFKNGKFHPLFFITLKTTYDQKGIIYTQRNFGKSIHRI